MTENKEKKEGSAQEAEDNLEAIDKLKEQIINEYPRLGPQDQIKFSCHRDLSCFNKCCRDVNIALTPYDVMRLKNRLGITSSEFLDRYTILPFSKNQKLPVPILRMEENEDLRCPFVDQVKGCTVYEDRPWPCRMYPVGEASPKDVEKQGQPFYFLVQDEMCKGLNEDKELTILDWIDDQGIAEYNEMGELFKELTLHDRVQQGKEFDPKHIEIYYMSLYDQDKFKRFLFDSTFLERFELEADLLEKLKESEIERLKFAHRWLKFCMFNEKTMQPKQGEE